MKYKITYDYEDEKGIVDIFEGSQQGLQERLKLMKEQGSCNLAATQIPEYDVIMESDGGTKYVFFSGFESEQAANEFCEQYNWEFKDENDFVWKLYVEEAR